MQYAHKPRQTDGAAVVPSASGVTGGTTAVSVGLGSSLLLGPSGLPVASVSNALNPNDPLITVTGSSPTQTSSPSSSSAALPSTSSSMSTGAILGISAAVFVVAVAAMYAVYKHFKRRTYAHARQPLTRGSPPTSRVEGGDRGLGGDKKWERLEGGDKSLAREVNPTAPKTPEIGKFELFEKDPSVRSVSDEKANNTFDPAAMPNFVQYPNLADDLSVAPPSRPFASGAQGSPVSWGGETAADSFLSLRSSDSMSPSAVMARQTPRTTDSAQHRWESAEVLIMDEAVSERPSVYSEATRDPDPFRDDNDLRASLDGSDPDARASSSNPFFNASQHNPFSDQSSRSRSRKSSISTVKRSRSRSNSVASRGTVRAGAGDNALLSLIAALDTKSIAPDDLTNRASMQTTTTSLYTPVEGSAVPPTPKAF